jgi:hypothetical protein
MGKMKLMSDRIKIDRMLAAAIAISLFWHFFWIFGVKVIIAPKNSGTVKFSKVSFLGPILERGALEVRMATSERSIIEKRYLTMIGSTVPVLKDEIGLPEAADVPETDIHSASGADLSAAAREALGASKLEPDYKME